MEKISENGAVWPVADREVIREVVPDQVFPTPTGRMELYYDGMVPFDQQLPQWEPCTEIADESLRAQFPLQLTNTRTRFRIHNQFYDSDWLQLMYEPLVMLNPADMASRGLETGDVVRVFTIAANLRCTRPRTTPFVPARCASTRRPRPITPSRATCRIVTNNTMIERGYDLMCGPVIPFSDTLVEIEKA